MPDEKDVVISNWGDLDLEVGELIYLEDDLYEVKTGACHQCDLDLEPLLCIEAPCMEKTLVFCRLPREGA